MLGIVGAYLFALVIRNSIPPGPIQSFLQIMVMLVMAYVGLAVGANKGDLLNLAALGGIFDGESVFEETFGETVAADDVAGASGPYRSELRLAIL